MPADTEGWPARIAAHHSDRNDFPGCDRSLSHVGDPGGLREAGRETFAERRDQDRHGVFRHQPRRKSGDRHPVFGTVSAADLEGTICGIQSVAVSVNSHEVKTFEYAKILPQNVENVAGKLSTDIALNINVPNLPPEEVKGIKYARLGNREYKEFFSPIEEGSGYAKYRYTGDPVVYEGLPDTIDVIAMQDGYASITPLHRDLTDYNLLKEMEKWRIEK